MNPRRNLSVLFVAQAVLGCQAPVYVILGGLAGALLADSRSLATLPVSVVVLFSMFTAPAASLFMGRYGRRAGFLVGAAAGAYLGRKLDAVVDGQFVKEVEASMGPGTSALFLVFRKYEPAALTAWLQPYAGRVYQTTLSPELVEQLDRALQER